MKKRVLAIVQARMGSKRFPGKVLNKIGNKTILEILCKRLEKSKYIDEVIIATTTNKRDDPIVNLSKDLGLRFFRGSEDDVLGRYEKSAKIYNADVVVRVTADNPLTDPELADRLIFQHIAKESDYTYSPDVPLGLGVEVINTTILEWTNEHAKSKQDREHVTLYVRKHPELFSILEIPSNINQTTVNNVRLTVDTEKDLDLIIKIYEFKRTIVDLKSEELFLFLTENHEITMINANVKQYTPNLEVKNPFISVIIRSHNSEDFIKYAIDSALNQSLNPEYYEIIVVEDGSTDNTRELLEKYKLNIEVIETGGLGAIEAANLGIKFSKGDYFILLDSDDYFELSALEEFYNALMKTKSDFVYSDYFEKHLDTREIKTISLKENILNSVAGGILFKKSVFTKMGMYNTEIIFPEYEILIKLMKSNYKGLHIPKPLFTYCRHDSSLTGNKKWIKKGLNQLNGMYTGFHFERIIKDLEGEK